MMNQNNVFIKLFKIEKKCIVHILLGMYTRQLSKYLIWIKTAIPLVKSNKIKLTGKSSQNALFELLKLALECSKKEKI